MFFNRYRKLLCVVLALCAPAVAAGNTESIRVGVLKFGTVNWVLDVVEHHQLAQQQSIKLEIVPLASKSATHVAIQGGAVDVIVTDWVWVSRQRAEGRPYTFAPYSTAIENVSLVLPMEKQGQAQEFLDKVGLAGFEHAYPGQLSGGMQRRVSLARAFAFEPQLLLMDEPFQSLDAPTADQLRDLLLEFWKHSGCTVLFVTHSLREALAMAERILFFSPRPASVVNEFNVDLARPRKLDGEGVSALYHELIKQHPRLLSGLDSNPESSETIRTHEWHETRAV